MQIRLKLTQRDLEIISTFKEKQFGEESSRRIRDSYALQIIIKDTTKEEIHKMLPKLDKNQQLKKDITWNISADVYEKISQLAKEFVASMNDIVRAALLCQNAELLYNKKGNGISIASWVLNNSEDELFPIKLASNPLFINNPDIMVYSSVEAATVGVCDFEALIGEKKYKLFKTSYKPNKASYFIAYNNDIFFDIGRADSGNPDIFAAYLHHRITSQIFIIVCIKAGDNTRDELLAIKACLEDMKQRFPNGNIIAIGDFRAIHKWLEDHSCIPEGFKIYTPEQQHSYVNENGIRLALDHAICSENISVESKYDWGWIKNVYPNKSANDFLGYENRPHHAILYINVRPS